MARAEVRSHRPILATAAAVLAGAAAVADAAPDDAAKPPAETGGDLAAAVEGFVGAPVRGTFTTRYRLRRAEDGTDQDLYEYLDLRIGDQARDRVSAAVFVRAAEDLDRAHEDELGRSLQSIDDTFDHSVDALLYSAYATVRPERGPFETVRLGRQYVYAAETFHVDGVSARTRLVHDGTKLALTAYGGVPVHFYEASASGDWLAGVRADAEPWKDGRAALDFAHVDDRYSLLSSDVRDDLAAASVSQRVAKHVDVDGRFQWLDGPREAELRATANFPELDLLVQAAWQRLFEQERRYATEFDPYTNVLQRLAAYDEAQIRVGKGLGEHVDVEAGASARRLVHDDEEGPFNRETRHAYVTPTWSDGLWDGLAVSVTGETYRGDDERLTTWGLDLTQKFGKDVRVSVGSDYTLYGFGPVASEERSHVRTAYARAKFKLSDSLSADLGYTWERDDVETFHVLTLALVLDF